MDLVIYSLLKKYIQKTLAGGGALKGKNCTIQSIDSIEGGKRVTFKWTLDDGTVDTDTMDVMNGDDGLGIKSVDINSNNHLIVTYDNNTTQDAGEIKGGGTSEFIGTMEKWKSLTTEQQNAYDIVNITEDGVVYKIGVPSGGTTGQVLAKKTDNDYELEWINNSGGTTDTTYCEFVHEPQYVACVGAEFNIYFDNICKTKNNANIYFTVTSSNNAIPVTTYDERFCITPVNSNVGTSTITVTARRKDTAGEVARTTFTLKVVAKTALTRNVRVMLIGDSITNGGWNYNLPNMMNVTFYGTLGTSPRNHEGRVSWKASDYCTQQTYNTYTNPFYNPNKTGTIKFDFAYYMENHPDFANVDYVNIMLGRNDGYTTQCVQYIKAMVDNILEYNNDIRVTVSFGYQKGYQLWDKDKKPYTYDARAAIFAFDNMLREEFGEYTRVNLIPTFINTDNVYDHGEINHPVSARNIDFKYPVYVSDGVHFLVRGYYKIGDVYYNYLNYLTGIHPLPVDPTSVDKTVLESNIASANSLLNTTTISTDGTDIPSNQYWVTQEVYDTFENAISDAQDVDDDADATQSEVDTAVSEVSAATTTFDSARQPGSAEPAIIYPANSKYYILVRNATQKTYNYIGWSYGSGYYPVSAKLTNNGAQNKVFITVTMGGTATSFAWNQWTSSDGVNWTKGDVLKNINQWAIPNAVATDNCSIKDSKFYVAE